MYTFIKNCKIIECDTLLEVASYFRLYINPENGTVYFNDKKDTISYNMNEYSEIETYKDFVRNRLPKFVSIYKSEKL